MSGSEEGLRPTDTLISSMCHVAKQHKLCMWPTQCKYVPRNDEHKMCVLIFSKIYI
jgi:hypothetical protein